jgi:hypothetical protein
MTHRASIHMPPPPARSKDQTAHCIESQHQKKESEQQAKDTGPEEGMPEVRLVRLYIPAGRQRDTDRGAVSHPRLVGEKGNPDNGCQQDQAGNDPENNMSVHDFLLLIC